MKNLNIERWLDDSNAKRLKYFDYWNDEKLEQKKAFYLQDGDFLKMENYLQKSCFLENLKKCIRALKTDFKRELEGTGIDLAAGTLWAVPHLLSLEKVDKLYCLEYSKHRLFKIGPKVLEHYNVPLEKVVLVYGNFYDLKLENNSLDFVFLSAAFHHANRSDKLLSEIRRVLKPKGIVIIIGEHIINYHEVYKAYFKHILKFFISLFIPITVQQKLFKKSFCVNKLIPKSSELFSPDSILGDHYYTVKEYKTLFSKYGFKIRHIKPMRKSQFQSFILIK